MRFRSPHRVTPEITLTPLIDILFIVLIFLVLTTSFKDVTAIRLSLPATDTARIVAAATSETIRIVVTADGDVRLGDENSITLDALETYLRGMPAKDEMHVLLAADTSARHGRVIEVMDRIRRAGIFHVDIQTLSPRR